MAGNERTQEKMEAESMSSVDVIKGATEMLGGKGVALQSDRVSTSQFACTKEQCQWKDGKHVWLMDQGYNWPFRNWRASEIQVLILFEYNGCDINDARLVLSGDSFNKWYNDKATFEISAKGGASKRIGPSGCPVCCKASSIVHFDVSLAVKFDLVRTDNRAWLVEIVANGSVSIIDR